MADLKGHLSTESGVVDRRIAKADSPGAGSTRTLGRGSLRCTDPWRSRTTELVREEP